MFHIKQKNWWNLYLEHYLLQAKVTKKGVVLELFDQDEKPQMIKCKLEVGLAIIIINILLSYKLANLNTLYFIKGWSNGLVRLVYV